MRNQFHFPNPNFFIYVIVLVFSNYICFLKCENSVLIPSSNLTKIQVSKSTTEALVKHTTEAVKQTTEVLVKQTTEEIPSTTVPYESEEEEATSADVEEHVSRKNSIPLPKGYNRLEIPVDLENGEVTKEVTIGVSMFIRSVLDINEKEEVITLDTDFRVHWVDWKIFGYLYDLDFKDPKTGELIGSRTVAADGLKKIWKPDIFIDEMDSVQTSFILDKLVTLQFLGDTDDEDRGDIVYTSRDSLKLRCDMDFHYYPADTQTCDYHIRSYSYNETFLLLKWAGSTRKNRMGVYLNDPSDPNFSILIEGVKPEDEFGLFINEKFDRFRSGKYSVLKFSIKIRRELSYHIVQTYLPSIILILITWLCFLLPTNMVEARIGISMTTLLTLTAMFASVREQSPEVSYTMAIDIWMVFCILCVFVALLLFTVIYWMKGHLKRSLEEKPILSGDSNEVDLDTTMQTYQRIVRFSKVYAFWAFAIAFLTFLCVYWSWLLTRSGYSDWQPNSKFNADPNNKTTNLYKCYERNDNETDDYDVDGLQDC